MCGELDHWHGLKAGVTHRPEYDISVWYCDWTSEGLQYSFQPNHWCTRTLGHDLEKPFILTTDWSKLAVVAVLSQMQPEDTSDPASGDKEYVIAYSSPALNQAESHYAPTEGECLALVWATMKFRQYLHGYKFRVRTDHAALQ